jgi:hypothetical protein
MKILLIEDDAETAQFIAEGLWGEKHDAGVAANGREGLNRGTAPRSLLTRVRPSNSGNMRSTMSKSHTSLSSYCRCGEGGAGKVCKIVKPAAGGSA